MISLESSKKNGLQWPDHFLHNGFFVDTLSDESVVLKFLSNKVGIFLFEVHVSVLSAQTRGLCGWPWIYFSFLFLLKDFHLKY